MTARTTGMLFILALAFGLWLWHSRPVQHTLPTPETDQLFLLAVDSIIQISVQTPTSAFECVRNNEEWVISKPVTARANPAAMDKMTAILEQLPVHERLMPADLKQRDLSAADYGLASPSAVISVSTQRDTHRLDVGDTSPLGDAVYVKWQDSSEIIATSTGILTLARTEAKYIRDPRLSRAEANMITRLELKAAGRPLIQLTRDAQSWTLQKPRQASADTRRVHDLLTRILKIEANLFISETMADPLTYGLGDDEAALQISLGFMRNGHSERLAFGKSLTDRPELVYACVKDQNTVVAVERDEIESLSIRPEDIRSKSLPLPPLDQVRAVHLKKGETGLSLVRGPDRQWWMLEPERALADKQRIEGLLRFLAGIRVQAFWPAIGSQAPALDMSKPAGMLCLSTAKVTTNTVPWSPDQGEIPADLFCLRWQIWGDSKRLMAVHGEDDEFLELPHTVARALEVEPFWFRDLTVLTIDSGAVRRISLRTPERLQTADLNERNEWRAAPVSPGITDTDTIRTVLAWAAELRALRLESDSSSDTDTQEWRLPRLSLILGLSGDVGIQKTINFGADTPDGIRVKVQGQHFVWIIDRTIPHLLLKHGLLQPEPVE